MGQLRDDLIAAKALIDTPEKWTQHVFRDGNRMCARGACKAVSGGSKREIAMEEALEAALPRDAKGKLRWASYVARYNDAVTTTHADIMALFDRAIEAAS